MDAGCCLQERTMTLSERALWTVFGEGWHWGLSVGCITRSWRNESYSPEQGSRWHNTISTVLRMDPRTCLQVCAKSGLCIWPGYKYLGGKGKQEKQLLPLTTFSQSGIFKCLSRYRYKLKKILEETVWNTWLKYQCSDHDMSRVGSHMVSLVYE